MKALAKEQQPTIDPEILANCPWKAHKSLVTSLAFLPDGQCLLSASWDGTVRLWKVNDGTKIIS
jgi:WD40 repeat protein